MGRTKAGKVRQFASFARRDPSHQHAPAFGAQELPRHLEIMADTAGAAAFDGLVALMTKAFATLPKHEIEARLLATLEALGDHVPQEEAQRIYDGFAAAYDLHVRQVHRADGRLPGEPNS